MRTLMFSLICALLLPSYASAKLSAIPIRELIDRSDVIVIAKVTNLAKEKVSSHPDRDPHVTFADAVAVTTLKGSVVARFRFLAQTDFICSDTGAVKDELALFFLYRDPAGTLSVMAMGNGRMAVFEIAGKRYVSASSVIVLSQDAPTVTSPESKAHKGVELAYLEKLIAAEGEDARLR